MREPDIREEGVVQSPTQEEEPEDDILTVAERAFLGIGYPEQDKLERRKRDKEAEQAALRLLGKQA